MKQIPDDPIIRCVERTGYPPWNRQDTEQDDFWEEGDDGDVFYGNQTEDF